MTKISLAIIVRNAKDSIVQCIESVGAGVDEVVVLDTGSTDGTPEAVRAAFPNAIVESFEPEERHPEEGWICDFSAARNRCFDLCSGEAILWLDADDVLRDTRKGWHPGLSLRAIIEKAWDDPAVTAAQMRYDYIKDKWGNCQLRLPRTRVARKGCYEWTWPVHEDLRPLRSGAMVSMKDNPVYVDHMRDSGSDGKSAKRNLWIMQRYMGNGGKMSSRLWQNVGGSYRALGNHAEAASAYERALDMIGADAEAEYITRLRCGDSCRLIGRHDEASMHYLRAQRLFPDRKQPFLALAEECVATGEMRAAMVYADLSETLPPETEGFAVTPMAETSVPLYVRARALVALGNPKGGLENYRRLVEMYPGEPDIAGQAKLVEEVVTAEETYERFLAVAADLPDAEREALWRGAPECIRTFPEPIRAKREPRTGAPVVAIYCGPSNSPWGPDSIKDGVGGSEEAVIFLSRRLARLGWQVEVYGDPPRNQIGKRDGVLWMPHYAWQAGDTADVFVGWRQWAPDTAFAAGLASGCDQKWLWLHDAIHPTAFHQPWMAGLDGIFCLTDFHAKPLPEHLRDKLVLTKNGLDDGQFVNGENKATEFIYASSPDRGLEYLLREWPKIREAVPGANLSIYYGFNQHWMAAEGRNPELRRIRDSVNALLSQPGVEWHGMVGQHVLSHAFAKAGFWLYPTEWPETSCITAMKAQAMGAIPITSRFPDSGVPETTKYDLGPPARDGSLYRNADWLADWTASVIAAAHRQDLGPMRAEMVSWARETYSWAKVASQWNDLFRLRSSEPSRSVVAIAEGSSLQPA